MLACGLLPGTRRPVWQSPDGRSVLGPKTGEEQRMDESTRKGEDISEEVAWAGGQSLVSQPIIYGLLPLWIRQTISVGFSVTQLSRLFPLSVCPGPQRKQLGLSVLCNTGLAKPDQGFPLLLSWYHSLIIHKRWATSFMAGIPENCATLLFFRQEKLRHCLAYRKRKECCKESSDEWEKCDDLVISWVAELVD